MTTEQTKQQIAVMQSYVEGKTIQWRERNALSEYPWKDCDSTPAWSWLICEYRIKPEPPMPREWWIEESGLGVFDDIAYRPRDVTVESRNNKRLIRVREVLD